jgi:hypothetical protein
MESGRAERTARVRWRIAFAKEIFRWIVRFSSKSCIVLPDKELTPSSRAGKQLSNGITVSGEGDILDVRSKQS